MDLKKIQKQCNVILDEVDRICKKYGIIYYLDSGTLLGAVRHKGFIPWDDDMDIAFMRKEYRKFQDAVKKEWKTGEYILQEPDYFQGSIYVDWVNHIIHTTEQWEEYGFGQDGIVSDEYLHLMVYTPRIDVFVIDNIPEDPKRQKRLFRKLTMDHRMAMGHRLKIYWERYKGLEKVTIWFFSRIGKCQSLDRIIARYNKHCTMYEEKNTKYCFYANFPAPFCHIILKKEWFQKGTTVEFEGKKYNAPSNPHEYLTTMYGEYMKLPPEEERTPVHISREKRD